MDETPPDSAGRPRASSGSSPKRGGDGEGRWRTALGGAGPYLGLGLQIALTMAFYVGAGLGLDLWLEWLPLFTILGALVGLGTVLYQVVRVAGTLGQGGSDSRPSRGAPQSDDEERPKGT